MKTVTGIVILLIFLCVHLIKMMRLYLIVMDQKISFDRYVPAYLWTTLVNLVIPYKLGELFRIFVFYRITKNLSTGFFAVITDRFFDTVALVLILLPYQLLVSGHVTVPTILLAVFVAVIVIAYMVFPTSAMFLNRYIITSRSSKRSMMALAGIERAMNWYGDVRRLVIGRYGLLLLFSVAAWILEMTVLAGFTHIYGQKFTVSDFGAYIESIVSGSSYEAKEWYTIASAAVIAVLSLVFTIRYCIKKKRGSAEAAGK